MKAVKRRGKTSTPKSKQESKDKIMDVDQDEELQHETIYDNNTNDVKAIKFRSMKFAHY